MATHDAAPDPIAAAIRYLRSARAPDHRIPLQDGSSCPHCADPRVQKWGRFRGRQRYRCRTCGRTFSTFTGTPLYYLKRPELWPGFLGCVDARLTVRAAGALLGVDKDTALRWRHLLLGHWRAEPRPPLEGRVVIGDFCLPHSAKGGRSLLLDNRFPARPPRHHGEDWSFPSFQTGPVTVLVAWESPSAMILESLGVGRLRSGDYDQRLAPRLRRLTEIVGCRGPGSPLAGFARRMGTTYQPQWRSFFPTEVACVRRELRAWLQPFRGVATRWLDNYLEWFRRRGGSREPQHFSPTEPDGLRWSTGPPRSPAASKSRRAGLPHASAIP